MTDEAIKALHYGKQIQSLSLSKAAQIIYAFNKELVDWGWVLALFGSTLNGGYSRDIDVIAFNRTDNTRPEDLDVFFEQHKFVIVKGVNNDSSLGRIYEYFLEDKYLRFDVHIRYTKGENWAHYEP